MEIVIIAAVILALFIWISGGFQRKDSLPPIRPRRKTAEWIFVRANAGPLARVHITDWSSAVDVRQIDRLWAVCGNKMESRGGFSIVDRPDYETVCLDCLELDNSETRRLSENIRGSPSPLT